MNNAPPPNLMQGIQFVQAGRKAEALPYLRYAVQNEPVPPDGWLWLAAATQDLDEYRYCVDQALRLDPQHGTAQQMRGDLERRSAWGTPGYAGTFPAERAVPRTRGNRLLRALASLVLIGACVGALAAVILSGVIQNAARDWLQSEDERTLEFTVGETPAFRFRVEVPETWMPANTDNPSWRERRDELIGAFPATGSGASVWETLEAPFSGVVRNPVYGDILPPVRLVETDDERLAADGMVAALTLLDIDPFPEPPSGETAADVCARMRLLEQYFQTGGDTGVRTGGEAIETMLAARNDLGDCIYAIHRRYPTPAADAVPNRLQPGGAAPAYREIMLAIPVGAERYALWRLTFADAAYEPYTHAIERILATLEYQE